MNVKQLKAIIENLPDNTDVFVTQLNTDYDTALVETAELRSVKFVDGDVDAEETVLVITDEAWSHPSTT